MADPEILSRFDAGCCTITLNRSAKLNALNLNMIRLLHTALDDVERRAGQLSCMIMDGAGGKAFCAGGDVAEIREESLAGGTLAADFFYEEYAVVSRLATLKERTGCCQVSLWDGITMGGGVGLSSHGPFRVATEKTVFAMPEMAIGFFPDVGALHKLGRLRLGYTAGLYMAVTGARLRAYDCLRSGLATHFVPSAKVPQLREALQRRCGPGLGAEAAQAAIEAALSEVGAGAQPSAEGAVFTEANLAVIDKCFSADALEEVVARLRGDSSGFARTTLQTMEASCSPTSCKVTMRAMQDFAKVDILSALEVEYRLSQRFTTRPQPLSDFYEGIRAVLVDKDRKQRWRPAWNELEQVDGKKVSAFFEPLEAGHTRGELQLKDMASWSEKRRKPFPKVLLRAKL